MSALARPGPFALLLVLSAVLLEPFARAVPLPGRLQALSALLVLLVLALLTRVRAAGPGQLLPGALVAAATVALLAACALDGLRGRAGTLRLSEGRAVQVFDETGPDGRGLGERKLDFAVGADKVGTGGEVTLAFSDSSGSTDLAPGRPVEHRGFRFAVTSTGLTGGASRLRVGISDGTKTQVVELGPAEPGRVGDMTVSLEDYFPDFALDQSQRPYTRSSEPRNPAALLTVEKDGRRYRAFAIEAMPGVHHVAGLDRSFSLLDVEPERAAVLAVHREPGAPLALLGGLLLVAGLVWRTASPVTAEDAAAAEAPDVVGWPPVAGSALVVFLALSGSGAVLAWTYVVPGPSGPIALGGAGVLAGAALLVGLGGVLLLVAQALAGPGVEVRRPAHGALWAAVALSAATVVLGAARVADLPGGALVAAASPLAGLALAAFALALVLRGPASFRAATRRALLAAVTLTAAAAAGAGLLGLFREGTWATPVVSGLAAAGLAGLAAAEATRLAALRRLLFLLALLGVTLM
jgi:hypothetical protein